jgi:hypothetical protein
MRRKIVSILASVIVSVMVVSGVAYWTNKPAEAIEATPIADDVVVCPLPPVVCVTITATVTLPGITLSLPPVTVRGPTVTLTRLLPQPTRTRTLTLPPIVETIIRPRRTVTIELPGETIRLPEETITVTRPESTVTIRQDVIQTGTASPVTSVTTLSTSQSVSTGQETVTHGTVVPTPVPTIVPKERRIQLPGVTVFQAAGIGLLSLLALVGLILLGMWGGYVLGFKNAERENTNFLRALRDSFGSRGKHS